MTERRFIPKAVYHPGHGCWLAQVWVDSDWVKRPCWEAPRTFGFAARFSARQMAKKLARLEKRGDVA